MRFKKGDYVKYVFKYTGSPPHDCVYGIVTKSTQTTFFASWFDYPNPGHTTEAFSYGQKDPSIEKCNGLERAKLKACDKI
jgi:hypothetical protein